MCIISVGLGIVMGKMAYDSSLDASEAQANALESQAEQENMAAAMSNISASVSAQNADNMHTLAAQEMNAADTEALDAARETHQERGSAIAKAAGAGVMIEDRKESMSTMQEADLQAELAYDQSKIMQNAEMKAWGYLQQAKSYGLEAQGHQYASQMHEIASASLMDQAAFTRETAGRSAFMTGLGQGLSTAAGVNQFANNASSFFGKQPNYKTLLS